MTTTVVRLTPFTKMVLATQRKTKMTATITASEDRRSGLYQYYVDGHPTGIAAEPINAGTDSSDIAAVCEPFIESMLCGVVGEVTHDKDTIFVEVR